VKGHTDGNKYSIGDKSGCYCDESSDPGTAGFNRYHHVFSSQPKSPRSRAQSAGPTSGHLVRFAGRRPRIPTPIAVDTPTKTQSQTAHALGVAIPAASTPKFVQHGPSGATIRPIATIDVMPDRCSAAPDGHGTDWLVQLIESTPHFSFMTSGLSGPI